MQYNIRSSPAAISCDRGLATKVGYGGSIRSRERGREGRRGKEREEEGERGRKRERKGKVGGRDRRRGFLQLIVAHENINVRIWSCTHP